MGTLFHLPASAGSPPDSNFAYPGRRAVALDSVAFEDGANATYHYLVGLPSAYNGGNITLTLLFTMASASSGVVRLAVAWQKLDTDVDTDVFNTATSADTTIAVSDGVPITSSIVCTAGATTDSVAAGDFARIAITRDVSVASNASGDLQLLAIMGDE